MQALLLGIEIGGTKVQVATGNSRGRIASLWRGSVTPRAGAAALRRQILFGADQVLRGRTPAGVGVGFGGPVEWRNGRVRVSHHVSGWTNFPLATWLARRLGARVFVDNDANVAALGEARCGAGRGEDSVFYLTAGSGIGGGLVVGGSLYHGAEPGEMEIGHTRIPREGVPSERWPILESLASGWAIDRAIRAAARRAPRSPLARFLSCAQGPPASVLLRAARAGDPAARRIHSDLVDHCALGFSHALHLAHPRILVLGGGLSLLGEPLRRAIAARLDRLTMDVFRGTWRLRLAGLGESAVPVGALLLAGDRLAEGDRPPRRRPRLRGG